MKTKILVITIALAMVCSTAQGQGILRKAGNAAERALERKAEQEARKAVNKAVDEVISGNKNAKDQGANIPEDVKIPRSKQSMESAYAKSGFVVGDDIIFDDPMDNETVGEFPSQWSLLRETSEVVDVNGKKTLVLSNRFTSVTPQMENSKNYLGDIFTLEFDYFQPAIDKYSSKIFQITFYTPDSDSRIMYISKQNDPNDNRLGFSWLSNNGNSSSSAEILLAADEWHHFAISFNKPVWRVYIDGVRVANVPNVAEAPGWLDVSMQNGSGDLFLTNFRIAQGASKLSDRVESDGKFVSYGINFDTAKSTIKPESMGELSRIAQLMSENPALKFSVEGHSDNTGDPAKSRALTEARAKVVVEKLVQMGVASNRLTSAGKGQENPIADNGTNVGRAKNNRIVFVKQ